MTFLLDRSLRPMQQGEVAKSLIAFDTVAAKFMRAFAISLCLLSNTAFGHIFDKSVLDNVSVSGNVSKPGNVDLGNRNSITVKGALESAGFDIAQLKTSKRPYPFAIAFYYVAERTPDTQLDLTDDESRSRSLATEVVKGGSIAVIDFEKKSQLLNDLKKQINSGWDDSPLLSFNRLHDIVELEKMIRHWKNPERPLTKVGIIKEICLGLSPKSKTALNQEISRQISEMKALALEKFYIENPKFISRNIESLSTWITDSDSKEAQ